jgi:hypothetical protein
MSAKIQGSVWMSVVGVRPGTSRNVQITRSLDSEFGLDGRAMEAALPVEIPPGNQRRQPVAVRR